MPPAEARTGSDLVLQPLVEPHAFVPLEGMRHVGVVGEHEGFDLLGSDAGIREVRSPKTPVGGRQPPGVLRRRPTLRPALESESPGAAGRARRPVRAAETDRPRSSTLWTEGYGAGLPLSFLDAHVKCGDSLVGVANLEFLTRGIPDEAYAATAPQEKEA